MRLESDRMGEDAQDEEQVRSLPASFKAIIQYVEGGYFGDADYFAQ